MPIPTSPLAIPSDVADIWRPLTDEETPRIVNLISKTSAKLRQKCPFDLDDRINRFDLDPSDPLGVNPDIAADVVATIVKRFLVNIEGAAASSSTDGPHSTTVTWVNRYDKTGSDVRGAIEITESDIDQLRPATPAVFGGTIRMRTPQYEERLRLTRSGPIEVVVPDRYIGYGNE